MAFSADEYSAVLFTRGLADLEAEVYKTIEFLIADGTPTQAVIIRQAYERLLVDLRSLAVEVAVKAEQWIKEAELHSRLRPRGAEGTPNQDFETIQDWLGQSHPLPGVEGAVGINAEPPLYDNVDWWWTQEEGYAGHVGREVKGYFYDAGYSGPVAPDPARFREHPLFAAGKGPSGTGGPRGGKGRKMTIQNPIPARHFVREGVLKAETEWHRLHAQARRRFDRELARIFGQTAPRP
jgi:hypothetical protein